MHEKLKHLDKNQVSVLIQRYYDGDKVSDLILEFDVDVLPSKLVSLFPPTIHGDRFCAHCKDENLVTKAKPRNSYSNPQAECPACKHRDISNCRCKNCNAAKEERKQFVLYKKQDIIVSEFCIDYPACPEVEELTHTDALYFISIVRHSSDENFEFITPYDEKNPELAPTFEFKNEIVRHLYSKGFIWIGFESDVDAFVYDDELTHTTAYYPTRVLWKLLPNLSLPAKKDYIKKLEKVIKADEHPDSWLPDINSLWEKIAKYECIEYLLYSAAKRDLPIEKVGEKTHSIFENVLEDYSIGQVFNLIFQSAMSTNDYAIRENVPKYMAKNMFIGNIQRKADKAKAEGWKIKNSRRDFNCPQSVISETFFHSFMGIGSSILEVAKPKYES